jgi:hypothetical protein
MFEVTATRAFFALLKPITVDGHVIKPGDRCVTLATDGHTWTLVRLSNGAEVKALAATLRVDTGQE